MIGHLAAAALLSLPPQPPVAFDLARGDATVDFTVSTLTGEVAGRFADVRATVEFDPATLDVTAMSARIEVAAVEITPARHRERLLSEDWFHAARHPVVVFSAREGAPMAPGDVVGELTIRDVTRKASFPLAISCDTVDAPCPEEAIRIRGRIVLDRTDYGMRSMRLAVGRDVTIDVDGIVRRRAAVD